MPISLGFHNYPNCPNGACRADPAGCLVPIFKASRGVEILIWKCTKCGRIVTASSPTEKA